MTISNARWLDEGGELAEFTQGQDARCAVTVESDPSKRVQVNLYEYVSPTAMLVLDRKEASKIEGPGTVWATFGMNRIWEPLHYSDSLDIVRASWRLLEDVGYPLDADFLGTAPDDNMLWPPYRFSAAQKGIPGSVIDAPEIRRAYPQYTTGNFVELLVDGNEALPVILSTIGSAQHHIHLNWFFFAPDNAGNAVADALIERAQAGVEVRLMFDQGKTASRGSLGGGFNPADVKPLIQRLKLGGVKVANSEKSILRVNWRSLFPSPAEAISPEIPIERLPNTRILRERASRMFDHLNSTGFSALFSTFGSIDHFKAIVVDGTHTFLGGMNCGDSYLYTQPFDPTKDAEVEAGESGNPEPWKKWHDAFVHIEGRAARDVQKIFVERWAFATAEMLDWDAGPAPPTAGTANVKVLANIPGLERDITAELVKMFRTATNRILIENPYFTDDLLGLVMCHAAKERGVNVDLVVPDHHADLAVLRMLMQARYGDWLDANVNIHEYRNHFTHVKVATVDGRYTCLGSYNFSKGSALRDCECNVLIDDTAFATEVEARIFTVDISRSNPITSAPTIDGPAIQEMVMDGAEPYL
jgi:cardiolipin synthase A/B